MKRLFITLPLFWSWLIAADSVTDAARGVIKRICPERHREFKLEQIRNVDKDVFEIETRGGKVIIRGSNAVSICSGFNWYLKHYCKCSVSWCGDNLQMPKKLPSVSGKVRINSPYKYGFYFNYCTFNYTMAWWDWKRWEREIDYMAICGINMPLAIVGSEALWLNFLKRFGYSTEDAKKFISGPGYTAWWLMGNLEGRGGPVTDEWIVQQRDLQRKILKRMRQLGMRPTLPGFVGLVPTTLAKKLNVKTLPQGVWAGGHVRPHVLHPDDPMFDKMAKAWYEELEKLYGKADCFAGDLFHEGGKTHGLNVGKIATKVQNHMLDHNPDSIWTIQGWGGNPRQNLLKGLEKKNTLVVELCNEFWRNWESSKGFYGYPWTFSTVIMYGGNVGFHGRLDSIAENLNAALESEYKPVALGATWESIEVNPVVMDFLWDMKWREKCPDLKKWIQDYAVRRYGTDSPQLRQAWLKLLETVYGSYPGLRRPQESLFCAKPSLNVQKASPYAATIKIQYDQRELRDVLKLLLSGAKKCARKRAYRFDVVDVTRQFLANAGQIVYKEMVDAFNKKDLKEFQKVSAEFLQMMDDQDRLLASEPMYTVGRWLHDARRVAPTKAQAEQNEKNARWLISTWTDNRTGLDNYAWKEWAGMIKNYYKPRWQAFIENLSLQLQGKPQKKLDYYAMAKAWGEKSLKNDFYDHKGNGNPIAIAKEIFKKYSPILDNRYKAASTKATKEQLIGTWEYKVEGATWKRVLKVDGQLELYRNNQKQTNWNGFTWEFKNGTAILKRANGSVFCTMKLVAPGKADFGGGMKATHIETGKNKEAEEAVEL